MNTDYTPLLRTAINAALQAGKKIMEVYRAVDPAAAAENPRKQHDPPSAFEVEYKADESPLTIADKRAHVCIMDALRNAHPEIPVLSEEGREFSYSERHEWTRYWLVDPLDGTKDFIKRNGEFTVNIALVERAVRGEKRESIVRRAVYEPVLGVVYLPVKDILYYAAPGVGTFRATECLAKTAQKINGKSSAARMDSAVKIPDGPPPPVGTVRVVASRNHMNDETRQYIDSLHQKFDTVETLNCGSSLKICAVAEGTADLYPRFGPTYEWDIAAGYAVATGAGCTMTRTDGSPLEFNKEDLLNPFFLVEAKGFKKDLKG